MDSLISKCSGVLLDLPDVLLVADEGRVRYGVTCPGKLGWTAEGLLNGYHHTPHQRGEGGVPMVK